MSLASDLVGTEIMSGDPDAVSLLAKRMSNLARDVDAMRDKFSARYLGGIWQGPAFDAFADTLEDVPKDLEKVSASYTMASSALDSFHVALAEVQRKARELARQSTDAESRVNTADGDRTSAKREVKLAKSAVLDAGDPLAKQDAQRRLQYATSALGAAEQRHGQATSELNGVHSSASSAVETFRAEVELCCHRLHDPSHPGIQNSPLSWWNRNVADSPLGIVVGILVSPIEDLVALPARLIKWAANPSLASFRELLDSVGAVVLVAALVVVAIGTGGTALLVVGALGVGVAALSLGVDAVRAARGDISPGMLIGDVVGLGLSVLHFKATSASYGKALAKADSTGSKTWVTRYRKYGESGQHMTKAKKLEELRHLGEETYAPRIIDRAVEGITEPEHLEPCVVPSPGIGASPVAVIRHVRPIVARPIVLAHAA